MVAVTPIKKEDATPEIRLIGELQRPTAATAVVESVICPSMMLSAMLKQRMMTVSIKAGKNKERKKEFFIVLCKLHNDILLKT